MGNLLNQEMVGYSFVGWVTFSNLDEWIATST